MIEKLKLVNNQNKEYFITLHPEVTDILFEHRRHVKSTFLKIKGHYDIAYFGINIINPSNELVSFSSMPHIEYNMIKNQLWKYDPCFFSNTLHKNILFWWNDICSSNLFAEQIKQIKLANNHFTAGMTLCREVDGFCFLYSYATHSTKKDLQGYFASQIFGLIDIGDYFCNSVLDIYSGYCGNHSLPQLNQLKSKSTEFNTRSILKLIVNNS